jgi:hypothetical protein
MSCMVCRNRSCIVCMSAENQPIDASLILFQPLSRAGCAGSQGHERSVGKGPMDLKKGETHGD